MAPTLFDLGPTPSDGTAVTQTRRSQTTFPVGARFPRRTAADVLAYLTEKELRGEPVRPTRPVHPIGARVTLR